MEARVYLCACLVGLTFSTSASAAVILYVDANATGPLNDGSSWCSAYLDLQDAIAVASAGDQIRVADGTYTPDRGTGDRLATFRLLDGVELYGGYAGCGSPDPDERDIVTYETIFSGDLNGDDGPDFANNDENSYHVVTYDTPGAAAVLDGFTVTAGNADGTGPEGTITNQGSAVHIRDGGNKCIPGGPTRCATAPSATTGRHTTRP